MSGTFNARTLFERRWVRVMAMHIASGAMVAVALFAGATFADGQEKADGAVDAPHIHATDSTTAIEALAIAQPTAHVHGGLPAEAPDPGAASDTPALHTHAPATQPATNAAAPDETGHAAHGGTDSASAEEAASLGAAGHHTTATADELACLADLTAQAKAATTRFEDFAVAQAEGYVSNRLDPSKTHHPNPRYKRDGLIFELSKPESLIYVTRDDGSKRLVGALYHAPIDQGPTPCGNATFWHIHGHCVDDTGIVIPESKDKTGPAGYQHRDGNVEMMHLWFVPRGRRS
jgi:hypothetical protein